MRGLIFILGMICLLFSCSNNSKNQEAKNTASFISNNVSNPNIDQLIRKEHYENNLESFTEFCKHLEKVIFENDLEQINSINHSGKKIEDLGLDFFRDTNNLTARTPKLNKEMGGYELESYYASEEKDEEGYPLYESGLFYYFGYNIENKAFELKEVLMAG